MILGVTGGIYFLLLFSSLPSVPTACCQTECIFCAATFINSTFFNLFMICFFLFLGCLPHSISLHIQKGSCSSVTCGVVPSTEQYSGFPNWHNR